MVVSIFVKPVWVIKFLAISYEWHVYHSLFKNGYFVKNKLLYDYFPSHFSLLQDLSQYSDSECEE